MAVLIQEAEAAWCHKLLDLQHEVDGVQEEPASFTVVSLALGDEGEVLAGRGTLQKYPGLRIYQGALATGLTERPGEARINDGSHRLQIMV